jgi:hypothetical protein
MPMYMYACVYANQVTCQHIDAHAWCMYACIHAFMHVCMCVYIQHTNKVAYQHSDEHVGCALVQPVNFL